MKNLQNHFPYWFYHFTCLLILYKSLLFSLCSSTVLMFCLIDNSHFHCGWKIVILFVFSSLLVNWRFFPIPCNLYVFFWEMHIETIYSTFNWIYFCFCVVWELKIHCEYQKNNLKKPSSHLCRLCLHLKPYYPECVLCHLYVVFFDFLKFLSIVYCFFSFNFASHVLRDLLKSLLLITISWSISTLSFDNFMLWYFTWTSWRQFAVTHTFNTSIKEAKHALHGKFQ